jgi:hypothetical protein
VLSELTGHHKNVGSIISLIHRFLWFLEASNESPCCLSETNKSYNEETVHLLFIPVYSQSSVFTIKSLDTSSGPYISSTWKLLNKRLNNCEPHPSKKIPLKCCAFVSISISPEVHISMNVNFIQMNKGSLFWDTVLQGYTSCEQRKYWLLAFGSGLFFSKIFIGKAIHCL